MHSLKKIRPDKDRAASLFEMSQVTQKMLTQTDIEFASIIIKEYYAAIRELITAIMCLDGYKTIGSGAHIHSIKYIQETYSLSQKHIELIKELRTVRNRISYEGFFVSQSYVQRKKESINEILQELTRIYKDHNT